MNMFKKNGGFTLVELIVVIAILAILAGIAVPAYSGYINKANKSADESQIAVMNTALGSACALKNTTPDNVTVTFEGTTVKSIVINDGDTDTSNDVDIVSEYNTFYTGNSLTLDYYTSLAYSNGKIIGQPAE